MRILVQDGLEPSWHASKYLPATLGGVTDTAIELRSLTKRFGALIALAGLSLNVQRGEIFGLLGPNGSGKTTLINILCGLSKPTAGQAFVFGFDISRDPRAVRSLLGTLPQETALYEELSAGANMEFHAELYNVPAREREARIAALLDLVQLTDRRNSRVSTFSGGMKRRLALARALLHEPQLLYLDEPTLGVDVQSRRALWDYILGLKQQGKTVLLTTNYLEEANALCDRLAILDRGHLVAVDTPEALKQRYGDSVIDLELDREPSAELLQALRDLPGVTDLATRDGRLRVTANGQHALAGQVVMLATREAELKSISQREPNLDEIFLHLTGSALRD
jgi:ABC-2 type transport system ATP-binding protein